MERTYISGRILVVDDDAMSCEVLALLLEAEGYAVETAGSGDAALKLLRERAAMPEAVLTDMQMPGITGRRLAVRLRLVCGPRTVLLAMSGSGPAADEVEAFDGFLLKPFTMDEVAAALAERNAGTATGQSHETPSQAIQLAAAAHDGIPSILNETIYSQLAGSMQSALLHQLYSMCLDDARKRVARMRVSASGNDERQFIREAHAIKGGCGMLGATELYGIAAGLEASGLKARGLVPAKVPGKHSVNPLDELLLACERLERILVSRGVASTL